MQVEQYLKSYQPILYKTFYSSMKNNTLSHAYLIAGQHGTPLLEVAKFLAKSILCDDPAPFACNSCITCIRIDSDNYPDFVVYDGQKSTIKKDAVYSIETQFEKTALEKKGIRVYILHLIENMTVEAINAILKFLEEPQPNIYAFLTTNNENNCLPTIISRCQLLHLKPVPQAEVINKAIDLGVFKEDAELLSGFYNDAELLKETLENKESKEDYIEAKESLLKLLEALKQDRRKAIYIMQKEIEPSLRNKEAARYFLDMLLFVFHDILNKTNGKDIVLSSYDTMISELASHLHEVDASLLQILKARTSLNNNVNIPLLLDNLILSISKENEIYE